MIEVADGYVLHIGKCADVMADMPEASIDAICTDPPYGLEFMGAEWDNLGDQPGYQERGRMTPASSGLVANKGFAQIPNSYQAGPKMGEWHYQWAVEAFRVLKPGGYLLAFGGTRTYHRLACAVEDAGFEIRDTISWLYASGFPKSRNIARGIDGILGVEGSLGEPKSEAHAAWIERGAMRGDEGHDGWQRPWMDDPAAVEAQARRYLPGSDQAREWDGWGTALKPSNEPIVVARKPFDGSVAANVLVHRVGALNIDGCRVETDGRPLRVIDPDPAANGPVYAGRWAPGSGFDGGSLAAGTTTEGRWPPNLVLTHHPDCEPVGERTVAGDSRAADQPLLGARVGMGAVGADPGGRLPNGRLYGPETVAVYECVPGCPVAELDAQSGHTASTSGFNPPLGRRSGIMGQPAPRADAGTPMGYDDSGGASRFFPVFRYQPKAARSEREQGMPADAPERDLNWSSGDANPGSFQSENTNRKARNDHPTVKPVELMRWLIRLVCPSDGTVLDPFVGSGTTGMAAAYEHVRFIGIDKTERYVTDIAFHRIAHAVKVARDAGRQQALF